MNEELKVVISAEVGQLKKGTQEAQKSIEGFSKQSKFSMSEFSGAFSKMNDAVVKGAKVVATSVAAIGGALLGLAPLTKEYREEQAKLETAFEAAGGSADQAKETYNDLYRVLGDDGQATEAAAHLAKLTTNEQELSEWTDICQGVYATFGDSLPIESLTEAVNETTKTGQVTGALADALNWAGMEGQTFGIHLKENIDFTKLSNKELQGLTETELEEYLMKKKQYEETEAYNKAVQEAASAEDFFNLALQECNSEAEREQLIRQTLNGNYMEASALYEQNASSMLAQNEANAAMQESLAQIGEVMEPIMTMLTQLGADILADLTPYIKEFSDKYLPKIAEALDGVGKFVGEIINFIAEHWEMIITIGAIIAGIATAISLVSAALTVYNTIMAIHNAIMMASPTTWIILAVVAAITALVAIIVVCVKHWDELKASCAKCWEKVKKVTKQAVDAVVGFFVNLWDKTKEVFTNLIETVKEKFNQIKTVMTEKIQQAKEAVVNKFNEIKEKISEKLTATKEAIQSKFEEIKQGITDKLTAIKTKITEIFTNIKDTMTKKIEEAKTKLLGVFDSIRDGIRDKINAARDFVKKAIDKIRSFFDFEWELPRIKLPHFNVTGRFSLSPPSIPHFSVDWYARGGVFDKPNLFPYGNGSIGGLGEAGAEAIVPLENNTQWLDKIAEKLAEKSCSNAPIILQVDGKRFAEVAVDSINDLTKMRGSLPLKLV